MRKFGDLMYNMVAIVTVFYTWNVLRESILNVPSTHMNTVIT